ncbi:MAG: DUF3572 domain-containing protein [Rhizobiaceae bacterium]|nr:DUF3572 domain-containing protein [Rhizobiaceae bacterium]
MNETNAKAVAIQILEYLAGDQEQLSRFMALTGIEASEMRQMAGSTPFMVALLDYLLGNEPTLLSFTAERNIAPDDILKARHCLERPIETSM